MSQNEIVRFALNNRWLEEQGVPDMNAVWIFLHYEVCMWGELPPMFGDGGHLFPCGLHHVLILCGHGVR